jgi:hypothetical protein
VPPDDIVTSDQAAADYSASLEAYADRLHAAGVRICKWSKELGAKLDFKCE